jgi:DNA uptake protein ComE-like DNA-binding protein
MNKNLNRMLLAVLVVLLSVSVAVSQPPQSTQTATKPAATAASADLLDINSATKEQLDALRYRRGVFPKLSTAARMPKTDLVKKKVIPQATYDKIKNLIIAKQK